MATLEEAVRPEELNADILRASNEEVQSRTKLLDNEMKLMKNELQRIVHEQQAIKERIKDNQDKIKVNRQLPYLVGNVVEVCGGATAGASAGPGRRLTHTRTPPRAHALALAPWTLGATHSFWTWTRRTSPRKTAPTSTWTRRARASAR